MLKPLAAATALFLCQIAGIPILVSEARAAEAEIRLSEVQVTGVTVFSSDAIEATMEIGPGDVLDRSKVIRTAENIQSLYRVHGYEQVTIQTRLLKNHVLEMQVGEGSPTRIAELEFVSVPAQSNLTPAQLENWKKLAQMLKTGVGVQTGDILDQEKLSSAKRILLDLLAGKEYIGAKVEDVRANIVDPPAGQAASAATKDTHKWVKIEFFIRLGDQVTFGFRGNKVIGASRLNAIVDEQRTLGLGQDFVSAVRSRIEDEYRSLGYARVRVEAYTFERSRAGERHITYSIQEGPRVVIDSIEFDGNSIFSAKDLRDKFDSVSPGIVQRGYYVEKDVQHGAELLIEWMKSKGYLGAKLITINRSYVPRRREDERNTRVKLVIYLYESEQTLVQSVRISGSNEFSQEEIEKKLSVKEGDPLNIFAFSEGIEALKTAYRAKGYLAISIVNEGTDRVIRYTDENRLADISLEINEGHQYRVSQLLIEGERKTKERVIRREISLKEGDILEEPKLNESEARLRKLGIFSVVRASLMDDPEKPDYKIVKVFVEEADPGIIAGGPGFRNDLGVRAFGQVGYTNLWGENHSIFLNASGNRRLDNSFRFGEYQAQLSYNWPWFANLDLTFRPTMSLSGTQYQNFDAVTADFSLTWEKKLLRSPNLVGLFTYDIERVRQFDAVDKVDNDIFLIGSVIPTLRLDMRDNPLAPTSGLFSQISLEYADPLLLSQRAPSPIGYWKLQTRSDYTIPLAPMVSWFWSIRTGFEKSTVSRPGDDSYGQIPLIKQFALGGVGSLRGFSEQELNMQTQVIKGTLAYVNYRTQFDFPISGSLRFGPFLDAANLLKDTFSFGALRYGSGVGFHYLTPVGPVNLDYGFKLDPRPGEDTSQFYFSIGVL